MKNDRDKLEVFIGRCPSYRESKKTTKEWQKPTLGVRIREVYVLKRVKEND